jgi:hypothetical protein
VTGNGNGYPEVKPTEPTVSFEVNCKVILSGDWAKDSALVADSIRGLADNVAGRLKAAADDLEATGWVRDPGDEITIEEDP